MKRTMVSAALGISLLASACTGGLDPAWRVVRPRVVALVADRPEVVPGDDVTLHALAYDPLGRPLRYEWSICISAARILANADIPVSVPGNDRCEEPSAAEGASATVAAERIEQIVAELESIPDAAGFGGTVLGHIIDTAGLAFEVAVEITTEDGTFLARATKLVAITRRTAGPTTNPPPIAFRIGEDTWVEPVGDDPGSFECVVTGGGRPRLVVDEEVDLLPGVGDERCVTDECMEDWLESFPIYGFDGSLSTGVENAYYSWLVTSGELSRDTTRPPNRRARYTPDTVGTQRLWFVVRDGHLGQRACQIDVDVVARGS